MRVSATVYAGASVIPLHEHGHAYLCLVAAGEYRQRCTGREDTCSRGLLLVHPEGHQHADRFHPQGARCVDMFLPRAWLDGHGVRRLLSDYRQLRLPGADGMLRRIERELGASDEAAGLALQSAVLGLVAQALRIQGETMAPAWMSRVLERLRDAPQATPSLAELAALAGVHPAHLARTFKRLQGQTIGDYHRHLRITAACHALRQSSRPLAAIASDAGFNDQSHFARVFRRLIGVTPGAFRRDAQIPSP